MPAQGIGTVPVDWHTFVRYVGTHVEGLTSSSDICWLLKSHNVLNLVYVWHFSEEIRHPSWTEITFISTWWCDAVILAVNATTELTLHVFAVVIAVRVKDVHTYLYFLPLPPCPLLPNPLFLRHVDVHFIRSHFNTMSLTSDSSIYSQYSLYTL